MKYTGVKQWSLCVRIKPGEEKKRKNKGKKKRNRFYDWNTFV